MQDNNLPQNNSSSPSYVDDYQPPQPAAPPSDDYQPFSVPAAPNVTQDDGLARDEPVIPVNETGSSDVDADLPPVPESPEVNNESSEVDNEDIQSEDSPVVDNSPLPNNQTLETQNIFDLLGVSDGKDDEKEAFLDELQEVIWEDFIENDTPLLLNEEQQNKLKEIESKGNTPEVQEEMLVYLEEILPDLEDMMMDKALELKEDMVLERISGMKEFYNDNQEALGKIGQAEELISQNKWADAGNLLNEIK
ncbi:MAG: hypothetical protein OEX81_01485 [Candidatus Pacebacteria bacterium]|nr:hypothetical protein [Candidatus Paceibacterota bacterium]